VSTPAIRVENLGKRYRLGLTHAGSIRELVSRTTDRLLGRKPSLLAHEMARANGNGQQLDEEGYFWALKDVSFEVQPGEVVGIIGRNGAGKSTLLKILSRITAPTQGRVGTSGRVGSLLEVGTGFHPELTGRENVYLNGAILGMTKAEVRRRFDAITEFAGIEGLIDTPVKRYSSGMIVRLGFAVAAHLEPEILIVDEVLAVGDLEFQKKCLEKMKDVVDDGRTVLFVSHNMAAVRGLCSRSVLLDRGTVAYRGPTVDALDVYMSSVGPCRSETSLETRMDRNGTGDLRFRGVYVNPDNYPDRPVACGGSVVIDLDYVTQRPLSQPVFYVGVSDAYGSELIHLNTVMKSFHKPVPQGGGRVRCSIPRLHLVPGEYTINVAALDSSVMLDHVKNVAKLSVVVGDFFQSGHMINAGLGLFLLDHSWEAVS
jgi:lipopolysaccharide transport system ATP-binding protein